MVYDDLPIIHVVQLSTYFVHKPDIRGLDPVMMSVKHRDWRYIYKDGWRQGPHVPTESETEVNLVVLGGLVVIVLASIFVLRRLKR